MGIFTMKILLVLATACAAANLRESALYAKLLQNYSKAMRPVKHHNQSVLITLDLGLTQIINMDEKHQILIWNGWVRQIWNDYRLTWNATEYGIADLVFDKDSIWTPDMALYNSAKERFQLLNVESDERINVQSNGNILWMTPFVFRTICTLDVTYFPFDEQQCEFEVGSWAYTGDVLHVAHKKPQGDLSQLSKNSEWHVIKFDATIKIGYYKCCPEPYPSVIYKMYLRRRSKYYVYNIFIPSLLITLLAIMSFFLPESSGERVTLLITNFVSLAFFIMMLSSMVPPTSEVTPLLEIYLTAVFVEICGALILRCFIDTGKRQYKSPGWFITKFVNNYLAWVLQSKQPSCGNMATGMQYATDELEMESIDLYIPDIDVTRETNHRQTKEDNDDIESRSGSETFRRKNGHTSNNRGYDNKTIVNDENSNLPLQLKNDKDVHDVKARILSSLEVMSDSAKEKRVTELRKRELNEMLGKLDQFFFCLFTLVMAITLALLLATPPKVTL